MVEIVRRSNTALCIICGWWQCYAKGFRPFVSEADEKQKCWHLHGQLCLVSTHSEQSRAEIHSWSVLPLSSPLWKKKKDLWKPPRHHCDSPVMCSHSYMIKLYLSAGLLTWQPLIVGCSIMHLLIHALGSTNSCSDSDWIIACFALQWLENNEGN